MRNRLAQVNLVTLEPCGMQVHLPDWSDEQTAVIPAKAGIHCSGKPAACLALGFPPSRE